VQPHRGELKFILNLYDKKSPMIFQIEKKKKTQTAAAPG